jgi:hypothetical protein
MSRVGWGALMNTYRVGYDRRHAEMLLSSIGFMVNEVWLGKCINVREFIEKALPMIEAFKNA